MAADPGGRRQPARHNAHPVITASRFGQVASARPARQDAHPVITASRFGQVAVAKCRDPRAPGASSSRQ